MEDAMRLEILDPVQEPVDAVFRPAPRLATLNGKVLGLYSNNKLNSVRLMELIAAELAKDYDFTARSGSYFAFRLMEEHEWSDVAECDAVILANGDCGACSSSGIANAIDLEKRGIPCLLISTPPFSDAVRIMADVCGMKDARWAIVEHPIGSVEEDALHGRAKSAARQFREIILSGAEVGERSESLVSVQ
jgi:hypothetical protein